MITIGFNLENKPDAEKYLRETIKRSKSNDVARNPFRVQSKIIKNRSNLFFIMDIEPIYPNLFKFGLGLIFLGIIVRFLFSFVGITLIVGGCFVCFSAITHTKTFYEIVFRKGLVKSGYKGSIDSLSKKQIEALR